MDYGRQIAAALEAAHSRSVVHRDLKPQNIHITPEGWVKVLDFGLAQWLLPDSELESGQIATGGTPGYMSPEQCRGEAVDLKSDLWAFGAVLGECLTGSPVVRGGSLAEILSANRRGRVHLDLTPALPLPVQSLVRAALEPDLERRVASATHARQVLEEELLRLRAEALTARAQPSAEPAAAGRQRRGNLPRPLSSFVGRRALIEELAVAVAETPLLTITGPGGAGKTRISVEVAARLEPHFPGGVWFIDLALVAADDDVPASASRTMGIREMAGAEGLATVIRAIVESFGREPGLLIVDNCEHLIAGVGRFVAALLAEPAAPTVLATSRQPLGLPGERILPLPPLALPSETLLAGESPAAESVELFMSRAQSRAPGFAPGKRASGVLNEICRQLDGLPLGIELAASYARMLPLEEILTKVKEGRSLSGGSPSTPPRHRSLHDLVDWSYRLLPAKEQAMLRSLSVFRGGWALGLAEAVCSGTAGIEKWKVCDLLTHLVDRSLVEPEVIGLEKGAEEQPARYRLLETIRIFAAERLADADMEKAEIESRLLENLPEFMGIRLDERGPSRSKWIQRIEPNYANIIRALELALASGRMEIAFALSEPASYCWVQSGQLVEGLRWVDRVLARRQVSTEASREGRRAGSAAEARFLCRAAIMAAMHYQPEKARPLVDEALAMAREVGDANLLAHAHEAQGLTFMQAGNGDAAEMAFVKSKRLFEDAGDLGGAAVPTGNLGVVESGRGNFAAAMRYFQEYLHISRELCDWNAEAKAQQNIGWTSMRLGAFGEARASFEESLELLQGKEGPSAAMVHQNLGDVCISLGEFTAAGAHLKASCRIRVRTQDRVGLATSIMLLGRLADQEGNLSLAAEVVAGIMALVEMGEIYCSAEQRRSLEEWHADLAARLGREEMLRATARGQNRDLQGLLELMEP